MGITNQQICVLQKEIVKNYSHTLKLFQLFW